MNVVLKLLISIYKMKQQILSTHNHSVHTSIHIISSVLSYLVMICKSSHKLSTGQPTCYGQSEAKSTNDGNLLIRGSITNLLILNQITKYLGEANISFAVAKSFFLKYNDMLSCCWCVPTCSLFRYGIPWYMNCKYTTFTS